MNNRLSHTAKPSLVTNTWHKVKPLVPAYFRYSIRKNLQYIHSRNLNSNDALLLSYPKSGSTWLRSMLLMSITDKATKVSELAKWIPPLHMVRESRLSNPRIVRSHDSISTPGFAKASKTLVLMRDPRAITVSYHHHQTRRNRESTIEFCTDELLNNGFDNIGSWQLHASEAARAQHRSNVNIVRYEDLLSNTIENLGLILYFYEISVPHKKLVEVVEESTPHKLRVKRMESGLEGSQSDQTDVRGAKANAWQQECPVQCQQKILTTANKELKIFGYEISTDESIAKNFSQE